MKIIRPTALFVKKSGDTMTGSLTIKVDKTNENDGALVLQQNSATGAYLPIICKNKDGIVRGGIVFTWDGHINFKPWQGARFDKTTGEAETRFKFTHAPWDMSMRRIMLINSLIFG